MDDVFVYYVELPLATKEMVTPCADGYTVYINSRCSAQQQRKAYIHALKHIKNHDFESSDVQKIELTAHRREVRHG